MYDKVKVHFKDGTSTIIYVSEYDEVMDTIADHFEGEGWSLSDFRNYTFEESWVELPEEYANE